MKGTHFKKAFGLISLILSVQLVATALAYGQPEGYKWITLSSGEQILVKARWVQPKPGKAVLSDQHDRHIIVVKFIEGSKVRLRDGDFITFGQENLTDLKNALRAYAIGKIERSFLSLSEGEYTELKERLDAKTGKEHADLNLFFRIHLKDGELAEALINDLNALSIVEIAYAASLPLPPPQTPDFEDEQGYLNTAPEGVDARYAWTVPGGAGDNVRVFDIEYCADLQHEDLVDADIDQIGGCTLAQYINHGTAVLGELVAVDNGFGITGIVNNASATVVEPYVNGEYRVDLAIDIASSNASVGDIILIEQQGVGPPPDYPYVPVEYDPAIFARIEAAVSDGRVVVEPAGNGGADLDDPIFNGYFDRNNQDSGAILVAGGTSDDHSRWVDEEGGWASCYGSRIDVQGWADYSIVTLGYGDRYDGGLHKEYTATFGGTSGASAMVSGTATAPQGFYKATHGKILTPSRIREVLVDTGTPQGGDPSEHIGPLPDLDAALHELYTVYIGSTSYPTIQDALADAQSGDFVNVQKEVYIITDNIVVPSGVTLDIAPGCTLKFIPGSNLQLVANGTLDAQGTASEKIIFSSAALNPSRGDWYGIKFNDSSDDSKCKIEYCNIYYAKFGIYCYKASPTIKNNLFKYVNPYGAYLYRSDPKLEGNTFEDNNFGVYAYLSSPNFDYTTLHINNNDFISNDSYGLFLSNSSPTIANDNLIDGNGGVGVYCYNFSNPIIGKNTITDNTYDGICCSYTSYPNIFYNSYYDLGGCNTITGNHRHGVYAVGSPYPALGYYPTSPGNNNLHDNSGYEVYNGNSSGTILAESNYWGTEFYAPGDSVYGSVDDDPFLTGPAECTQELAGGEGLPLGSPDTPQYHNQLGARLLAEGRYKEASEAFQFVIDSYAETEEAKYAVAHIAICFQSMRKADLVVPYLEEVAD
ncbi:MAG: right-handed parallel beta-helix repeat-containing protein, partial [Candidatus Zixiibacteriota bacterium]